MPPCRMLRAGYLPAWHSMGQKQATAGQIICQTDRPKGCILIIMLVQNMGQQHHMPHPLSQCPLMHGALGAETTPSAGIREKTATQKKKHSECEQAEN